MKAYVINGYCSAGEAAEKNGIRVGAKVADDTGDVFFCVGDRRISIAPPELGILGMVFTYNR